LAVGLKITCGVPHVHGRLAAPATRVSRACAFGRPDHTVLGAIDAYDFNREPRQYPFSAIKLGYSTGRPYRYGKVLRTARRSDGPHTFNTVEVSAGI
jgi:hypothetical protein